jgi:hypothetical protein
LSEEAKGMPSDSAVISLFYSYFYSIILKESLTLKATVKKVRILRIPGFGIEKLHLYRALYKKTA